MADGGEPDTDASAAAAPDLTRPLIAETLCATLFAFFIVGACILAERFAIHNVGLALLMTAMAGAASFFVLAASFAGQARFLFNPALAFSFALAGRSSLGGGVLAGVVHIAGAFLGIMLAHMVTNTGLVQTATQTQTGPGVWLGEFVVTAVFVYAMLSLRDGRRRAVAGGLTLLAAALATPSTSFANPALTLARALTDSFTSIRLEDAALIAAIQMLAALAGWTVHGWVKKVR